MHRMGCEGYTVSAPQTINPHYLADLEQYLALVYKLNNYLMMPARRAVLETCKQALEIVLDLYETSNI